jgi:tetratricopeptide (TPR) repeat protein
MNDHAKGKDMLNKSVVEPEAEAVWTWFYSVEDGVESVSPDGAEYADKLNHIRGIVEKEGAEFFELLDQERRKQEASLTANAEYLSSSSAHESAEEKRAKHADNAPMSNDQSIKLAGKNKDEGNELFKHGTITDAMNRYMRAINILAKTNKATMTSEERAQADTVLLSSNLNMAQCVVKLTSGNDGLSEDERDGLLKRGIACADAALAIDPANPKAKYRKAVCLDRMRETEQAKKVIDDALKQNPEDLDLKGLYDSLVGRLKQQHEKSKKFFSKMFQ